MANASVRTAKRTVKRRQSVETVKTKQTASTFAMAKNIVKFVQVFFGFYSFFNILFWLAYTAKIAGQNGIYYVFKPAWDIVNIFYTYKVIEGKENIDFTGVVCSISLMVVVIVLKSICEYISELEESARIEDAKRLERAKKRAMAKEKGIVKNRNISRNKSSGFIFLMDVEITQISGFIQADSISPEEIAKIKTMFFKALLSNLNLNQVIQKGYYKKKLFLQYQNVSYFDDFIFYTKETLNSLAKEFSRPNIRIDFLVGINLMSETDNIKDKLDILDTVNKLGLKNEFICTNTMKEIYEYNQKRSYKMISKGVYNLSKNLNVSNVQEVYSLTEG